MKYKNKSGETFNFNPKDLVNTLEGTSMSINTSMSAFNTNVDTSGNIPKFESVG